MNVVTWSPTEALCTRVGGIASATAGLALSCVVVATQVLRTSWLPGRLGGVTAVVGCTHGLVGKDATLTSRAQRDRTDNARTKIARTQTNRILRAGFSTCCFWFMCVCIFVLVPRGAFVSGFSAPANFKYEMLTHFTTCAHQQLV